MSEGLVEEHNSTPALYIGMDVNKVGHSCDSSEEIKQGDVNAAQLLANSSSLVQAHAISDPIFAPVRKLPPEMLAKIFIECIHSLVRDGPPSRKFGMHLQQARARLGQVCRVWSTILNDQPGVWATLVLDNPYPPLEIVSLWIKRSRSHPLDISLRKHWNDHIDYISYMDIGDTVVKMLRRELWRIRSFAAEFTNYDDISLLFPPDLLTEAPVMQSLTIQCCEYFPKGRLGSIHCPQLHTLTLRTCDQAVESLISKLMENLRVLTIDNHYGDNMLYVKLLQAAPNLVSLTWSNSGQPLHHETARVALLSLKSLAFGQCNWEILTRFLRYLDVPLLEHLDLKYFDVDSDHEERLNMVLGIICRDGAVQLCRLTLGHCAMRWARFHAICHHLKHLESLFIDPGHGLSADELLITLSSHNPDFSSVCPQLKTLELSSVEISTNVLVDFVERRVKSDLGGPGPGLVTCLKLLDIWADKEVTAQLAKTHSLSVHILPID